MKIGNLEVYGVIYKITNKVNGKVYIGQTIQENGFDDRYSYSGEGIERVYKYHKAFKNYNNNYNHHLLSAIEKYGFDAFEVNKVFDIAFSKEELDIKEDLWINYFDCVNNGYNNQGGGANGKLSEESKRKIGIGNKGKKHTEESKRKISIGNKGKIVTKETRKKMSMVR